jgi:hypothetical protein
MFFAAIDLIDNGPLMLRRSTLHDTKERLGIQIRSLRRAGGQNPINIYLYRHSSPQKSHSDVNSILLTNPE